ncbi:ECF transporter S component [Ructibacterium gallinarum]|uniref:ECF transporter S component n=1 Tax=Ructibacterium gallinarum TaxID=2779355 RepID=A0A9D5LYS2_9FIRM|nr:ECF transporter S component [Ructibacterium gallinarum]MBE5040486.1 ECF transporter S component [Ructibacterium gallinarum]
MKVKKLTFTALFAAAGVLLPQIFHFIGGAAAGGVFLPMHFPVLLAGLLLGPWAGAAVGFLCPVLSCLMTGMPAAAKLPFMIIELLGYGIMAGLTSKIWRWNLYFCLLSAMAAGRLLNAVALEICGQLLHLNVPAAVSVWTAVLTGIPGIVVQIVLIPFIVAVFRKAVSGYDRT